MPSTDTLGTTTLAVPVGSGDTRIKLTSTSGIRPGLFLFFDGELVLVNRLDVDPYVIVKRGVEGSSAVPHVPLVTVYIGRGDQFYASDPVGRPPASFPVSPYINVINGSVWLAQGDANVPTSNRWWQKQTITHTVGPLGVLVPAPDITVST
jgi:hypothetical protein